MLIVDVLVLAVHLCVREMSFNYFLIFCLISLKSFSSSFEILSGTVTGVGVILASTALAMRCKFYECCDDRWINFNEQGLQDDLKRNVFGQHIAEFAVLRTLSGFYRNKNPRKALVMSFHGLTGSGKNYISNIIANHTYLKGTDSAYVHIYNGMKDFPHKERVSEYIDKIQNDITRYTSECGRSLFIFDEIDKMPPGVLDALKPYVDYYEQLKHVDYRKNVFIFLSNTGSSSLTDLMLRFWAEGKNREELTMKDVEPLINRGAFNENGGLKYSQLLKSSLIDVFVPFLPLEKKHVRKCVEAEFIKRKKAPDPYLVNEIADELLYFPEEVELFSAAGCKRIEQKVDLFAI